MLDCPDDYEIITPGISILAQPSVAVVDSVVDERGTRAVADEYLSYLYPMMHSALRRTIISARSMKKFCRNTAMYLI